MIAHVRQIKTGHPIELIFLENQFLELNKTYSDLIYFISNTTYCCRVTVDILMINKSERCY